MKQGKDSGFTLIELMFVLVIGFTLLYSQLVSSQSSKAFLSSAARGVVLDLNLRAVETVVSGRIDHWSRIDASQQTVDAEISQALTSRLRAFDEAGGEELQEKIQSQNLYKALPRLNLGAGANGFLAGGEPESERLRQPSTVYVNVTQRDADRVYTVTIKAIDAKMNLYTSLDVRP